MAIFKCVSRDVRSFEWKEHLRLKGSTEHWWTQAKRRVIRVCNDRGIRRLRDLTADVVERWLRDQADAGMSAGTRNGYRRACVSFENWCVRTNRLASNPGDRVSQRIKLFR